MGFLSVKVKGDFTKADNWLDGLVKKNYLKHLDKYGKQGVEALSAATPVDTGLTARSWDYKIKHGVNKKGESSTTLCWTNSNIVDKYPIAIILNYGHGNGRGGYVAGRNYIQPAIAPTCWHVRQDLKKALRFDSRNS